MDKQGLAVLDMDREALRREMKNAGIVKLHYFGDGRKVFIKEERNFNHQNWRMCVENITTGFSWVSGVPYYNQQHCVSRAEQIFGIKDWNAV